MKGKYHVIVQNKRLRYEFDIKRNITIIRGDSATGKTTLYAMIALAARQGDSSGVEVQCAKKCRILEEPDWKLVLPTLHDQIIFLDEDNQFLKTTDFAGMAKNSDNYFVIITVIVEDSHSGFEFFENICSEHHIPCRSAGGKSKLRDALQTAEHKNTLVVADGASIGPEMNELSQYMKLHPDTMCYLPESFEWIILKSGLVDGSEIQEMLEQPQEFIESQEYFSWARYFTDILIQYTQGTYLQYVKRKLCGAYLHEKSKKAILAVMEKITFDEKK